MSPPLWGSTDATITVQVQGSRKRQTVITGSLSEVDAAKLAPWMQSAPFKWPAHIGPSSKVVGAEYTHWSEHMLVPHEAIRWSH